MSSYDRAAAYRSARERITSLLRSVGPASVADRVVPATPAWRVHDLVAHLRGVVEDAAQGNLQGAPGDVWTAAQVERGRSKSMELLLEEWDDDSGVVEGALRSGSGGMLVPLLMDIHVHEQDLRGALEAPGHRSGSFYDWAVPLLTSGFRSKVMMHLDVDLGVITEHRTVGDPTGATLTTTDWEFFRAAFGRRSSRQITAYSWNAVDDPVLLVPHLVIFGPASADVIE